MTCNSSIYTQDNPKPMVSIGMGKSIKIKRVKNHEP